eukprot:CAMPEP_0175405674 /NCGR_PEP_ID=MMETSP0095-20121207/39172_1 /TAXON_ID=311494 /ORGANISM="Alexandrium monilatum, Strain CCMP3105" /LENGTH=150 /DNA_ID=CAMNT_0016704515 /DNA_START=263 /DNA_END=711 /DNA_ORIENTATION=+
MPGAEPGLVRPRRTGRGPLYTSAGSLCSSKPVRGPAPIAEPSFVRPSNTGSGAEGSGIPSSEETRGAASIGHATPGAAVPDVADGDADGVFGVFGVSQLAGRLETWEDVLRSLGVIEVVARSCTPARRRKRRKRAMNECRRGLSGKRVLT